jgi:hypothetical protein
LCIFCRSSSQTATACISHDISDFITTPTKCNRTIKSFGGGCTVNVLQGTIKWRWCDDSGKIFSFTIPNSYYITSGKCHLLSPQHWARTQKDRKPIEGTGEITNSKETVLYWGQRKHKLTIPLTKTTNVATFHLVPGFSKFQAFYAEAKLTKYDESELIVDSTLISDDEDDEEPVKRTGSDSTHWKLSNEPVPCGFGIDDTPGQGKASNQGWTDSHNNPKHYQPFRCPVYVLDNSWQADCPHHKWNERSRVRINLGQLPMQSKMSCRVAMRLENEGQSPPPQQSGHSAFVERPR